MPLRRCSYMIAMQMGVYCIMLPVFLKTGNVIMQATQVLDKSLSAFFENLDELMANRQVTPA